MFYNDNQPPALKLQPEDEFDPATSVVLTSTPNSTVYRTPGGHHVVETLTWAAVWDSTQAWTNLTPALYWVER
jgi:hypothetical protein